MLERWPVNGTRVAGIRIAGTHESSPIAAHGAEQRDLGGSKRVRREQRRAVVVAKDEVDLEAVHHAVGDNRIEPIADSGYGSTALFWVIGNQMLNYLKPGQPDDLYINWKKFNDEAVRFPLMGFVFDDSKVKNEIAELTAVVSEYKILSTGAVANPSKMIDERNARLKTAGIEKVPERFRDPEGRWFAVTGYMAAFCVNNEVLERKNLPMPASWEDLLDPVYKGEVVMPNPASSGTGYLQIASLLQMKGEEEGWQFLEALDENIAQYIKSGSRPCNVASVSVRPSYPQSSTWLLASEQASMPAAASTSALRGCMR